MLQRNIKAAIIDMYDNEPNQGMRCIKELLAAQGLSYEVFDARHKHEIPDDSFDIYISTGGPGSPEFTGAAWEIAYFKLIDKIMAYNPTVPPHQRKYVFFICHSFQMICRHLQLGDVIQRRSKSFGIFPVYKTTFGEQDELLSTLENPFWVADFRSWQVVHPNYEKIEQLGAKLLLVEKKRHHVQLKRAMMAIRISDELFATQFHPEADPAAMMVHFNNEERKKQVIDEFGINKYYDMLQKLTEPDKICKTHDTLIPLFLKKAITKLQSVA
jgi:GMP synthase-like glutamine amidotransferase